MTVFPYGQMLLDMGATHKQATLTRKQKNDCPTFRYPGGKANLSVELVKHMPRKGRKFVDLFGGRGNISFRGIHDGLEYDEWIINDIDRAPFYRAVKEHGDKFRCTEKTQAEFDRLKKLEKQGDVHALLMEPWLAWSGGTYDRGGGTKEGGRRSPESYEANMRLACEYLRKKDVRITQLDWLDCLQAEDLGPDDFVMVDAPYVGCDTAAYSSESISPIELITYLKTAPHSWLLTERREPMYVLAFGEPIMEKMVQVKLANFHDTGGASFVKECAWKSGPNRCNATVHTPAIDATKLTAGDLLKEIRACADAIEAARNTMNREMRERLLPCLIELRKRTKRKKPGFYETLAAMGINANTVRSWFYRSNTADEVIELLEEPEPKKQEERDEVLSPEEELLQAGDRMAKTVLAGDVKYAKKLAKDWVEARNIL